MCVCVCVCVCGGREREREREYMYVDNLCLDDCGVAIPMVISIVNRYFYQFHV